MRDQLTQPATREQVAGLAAARKISEEDAAKLLEGARARQIKARQDNPFLYGYEPPVWYVAKAVIRNPVWSKYERLQIKKRLGEEWTAERFAAKMRAKLGLEHPVTKLLIMGANRAAKTDFMSKLIVQTMMLGDKKCCSGAQTLKTQKKNQMARVWRYLPAELRAKNIATKKATSAVENISYTDKNGFAGSRITLENKSQLDFISYEQTTNSLEGVEYDLAWLDEEYGIGHYNLMTTRITSKAGVFVGTFTPLNGYTAPIAAFLNGSVVTRYHTAYLRPIDGGRKLPWKELNLTEEEYEKLAAWRRQGQEGDPGIPESRPEDCFEWLFDDGDGRNSLENDGGRAFDAVPRFAVCQGGEAAAIWFYGSDNPYGLPAELIQTKMADENAEDKIYSSIYGMAKDMRGRLIKTFTDENVVKVSEIPRRLVRCMVADPAPERNWALGWFGYHPPSETLYMLREWPGLYEVPGHGVPGAWVKPSDKNRGFNDGARGEAQESFGFSYLDYKFEIARLERWKNYLDWVAEGHGAMERPDDEVLVEWDESDGAEERQEFRLLDSRAAAQSKIARSSNSTLIEDIETNICGGWQVADGQKLEIGYSRLIDKFKVKRLMVSEACRNTIDCLKLLTGKDGQKGAAKDLVDLLRYVAMSDIWDYSDQSASEVGMVQASSLPADDRIRSVGRSMTPRRKRVWW